MRRAEVCPGERACPDAVEVACAECGHEWAPADIDVPGACGSCGSEAFRRLRCPGCRLTELEGLERSEAGQLLERVVWLQAAQRAGVTVTLDDVRADEVWAAAIVAEERERWERERQATA